MIGEPLDVIQMLDGGILLTLRLAGVDVKQVAEVTDAMMAVFMQGTKQLLQALLDSVSVGRVLIQSIRVAGHSVALLLVDGGKNALLMNGRQLALLHDIFIFHRFHQFLESKMAKETKRLLFTARLMRSQDIKILTGSSSCV